jgi:uncharacterized protein YggT (Ycf19 family)
MTPARWYLAVPDVVAVALTYLLIAYAILSLALPADNRVMRVLGAVTSPVRVPVAVLTPRLVPEAIVAVFTIACLYVIRVALFVASQTIR